MPPSRSGKEGLFVGHLARQVLVDYEVETVFGKGLLLDANSHSNLLLQGLLPGLVMLDEWIVLQRVLGSFDIDVLQGMGGEVVLVDIARGNTQEACLWDAEEFIQMGCIA